MSAPAYVPAALPLSPLGMRVDLGKRLQGTVAGYRPVGDRRLMLYCRAEGAPEGAPLASLLVDIRPDGSLAQASNPVIADDVRTLAERVAAGLEPHMPVSAVQQQLAMTVLALSDQIIAGRQKPQGGAE